ncbi:MAG TPA: PDZ domain-containing protein, partial [Allosphingosinicella sp.]
MNSNLFRSLALVGAVALVPATTAALAQVEVDTYKNLDEFVSVLNRVRAEYVDQVDDERLIRGAIDGMLGSLDPHSSYLDARDFENLMSTTDGNYGGLGLTVTMEDGAVKVIAATRGTPADRAGIKAGDYITHIDGQLFFGGTLDEAVERMRGDPGTSVRLRVVRAGREQPLELTVQRAIIDIPAVRSEVRDRVGIITVTTFNRNTPDMARRAIAEMERNPNTAPLGYVLDL